MFSIMRGYYFFLTEANTTTLQNDITGATILPGDRIFWRFTKHLYGTCNAAGTGIDLATA
jgi:hypothetical protein